MTRPTGISKQENQYQKLISTDFFSNCPKAVLAAIAVSFACRICEDDLSQAEQMLREEWKCLYNAGIVPQKPIK